MDAWTIAKGILLAVVIGAVALTVIGLVFGAAMILFGTKESSHGAPAEPSPDSAKLSVAE